MRIAARHLLAGPRVREAPDRLGLPAGSDALPSPRVSQSLVFGNPTMGSPLGLSLPRAGTAAAPGRADAARRAGSEVFGAGSASTRTGRAVPTRRPAVTNIGGSPEHARQWRRRLRLRAPFSRTWVLGADRGRPRSRARRQEHRLAGQLTPHSP